MKYTQLRSFHAVAKVGSFTGAAKELNVSQPTISEQVRMLEATYGIEVFNKQSSQITFDHILRYCFCIRISDFPVRYHGTPNYYQFFDLEY